MSIVKLNDFYPLLEDKVTRLIDIHSKNGFAIISACRGENTREENLKKTSELKTDLKNLGWTYTIAYGGGFVEKGSEGFDKTKPKFNEISLVVYNYNRKENHNDLLKDMISLCKKYNQDDIYYQEPNGKAYWYDKKGNKDATFSLIKKNDEGQQFFTGFGSSKLSKKMKEKYLETGELKSKKAFEHRFSGIMEGVETPPSTNIEAMRRKADGEIFISSFNVLTEEETSKILRASARSYFNY